jgi:carbon-monoxide dehydrogenase small subunit
VDGEPQRSCLTPLAAVEGAEVSTVEGLGTGDDLSPVQAAFHQHYAAQCGFCTPGMIVAATHLIESTGRPLERDDVLAGLEGHYCRCTGYVKIVDAVLAASRGESTTVEDVPVAVAGEPEVQPKGSPA